MITLSHELHHFPPSLPHSLPPCSFTVCFVLFSPFLCYSSWLFFSVSSRSCYERPPPPTTTGQSELDLYHSPLFFFTTIATNITRVFDLTSLVFFSFACHSMTAQQGAFETFRYTNRERKERLMDAIRISRSTSSLPSLSFSPLSLSFYQPPLFPPIVKRLYH